MSKSKSNLKNTDDGLVPDDILTGHSYDGIEEFDNPLPGWWKWLFIGSIIFAFPYLVYFHAGAPGRSLAERYDSEVAANLEKQLETLGEIKPTGEYVLKFMNQPDPLKFGKSVFQVNCATCHASDGGGGTGPNLCDEYYKNVKTLDDFITVLKKGAGNGAMPAWGSRLKEHEIVLVASYVASLRGSNPAQPKPPLGSQIDPWPTPPAIPEDSGEDSP